MKIVKRTYGLLASVLLVWAAQMPVSAQNLLTNSSFEEHQCNALGCSFDDWSLPLGTGTLNADDKLDGDVSLQIGPVSMDATLDNAVSLPDYYYAVGTEFKIKICYKLLAIAEHSALSLDCYWEPEPEGDAETMRKHDADNLQGVFADSITSEWQMIETTTTKPEGSVRLRIRVIIPKNTKVLFDAFRVEETGEKPGDSYIHIKPLKVQAVTTTIGNTVDFTTIHIEQGNITGTTTFELSGYNPDMFRLSATSLSSDESAVDLVVTYVPTEAGTHTATLNIDNLNHTSLFKSVQLTGTCIDPTQKASITATPTLLQGFEAVVGQEKFDTFTVVSKNCRDYVYLRVDHIKGAAFTIDGSMIGKNATSKVQVRFAPLDPGEYESTVTVYSEGVTSAVITLKGTGIKRSEDNVDWLTQFRWDESHPMKLMNETFDTIHHNKTLVLNGWQNVAPLDERPWWGFEEDKTRPQRGNGKYAKATAYQYSKDSTGIWEMFLVTPALDYKNSEGKIFAFSVMGEYMPDIDSPTALEIYYVEVEDGKAYFQDLTESFVFPTTGDENNVWRTYFLNLEPYAETMADVFHIAFRYIGPNGGAGAVTYYIDDVSWGRTDLPEIRVKPTTIIDSTAIVGQKKVLAEVEVTGRNLTNSIYLSIGGANYNRFEVSPTSLPAEGGKFTVSFTGQEEGVHEAYVVLSSKGAADAFIPMAVLCKNGTGIESVQPSGISSQKELRDGQIVIIRGKKKYSILGLEIQ